MSLFFKKRRPPKEAAGNNEIHQLIEAALRKLGRQLAASLSRKEQRMSLRSKKTAVVLFTSAMTALSLSFFYRGLFVWRSRPPAYFSPPEMSIPVTPHLPDTSRMDRPNRATTPTPPKAPIPDSLIP